MPHACIRLAALLLALSVPSLFADEDTAKDKDKD